MDPLPDDLKLYNDTVTELREIKENVRAIALSLSQIANYLKILVEKSIVLQ